MSTARDYSSQSYSPSGSRPLKSVDTSDKRGEKKSMVDLNDKFVKLIEKVKTLEDENLELKTKLKILKEYEAYKGKVDDLVRQEQNDLEQQIQNLLHDQEKLQDDLENCMEEKEHTKKSYEDEIKLKDEIEKEFIVSKKELDSSQLDTVQLTLDLEDLCGKLEFLRASLDEEIKELESQIQNKNVVLPANSKRSLDMEDIVENVKFQYANMAARSREEAEHWYKRKIDDMNIKAEQQEQDVRDIKRDIADLLRHIQRLTAELEALQRKEISLNAEIDGVRQEGEDGLENGRNYITQLEEALKEARTYLAGLVRDHQELMNIKLALDIEIATYRKLLEGEEERVKDYTTPQLDLQPPAKPEKPQDPTNHVPPSNLSPPDSAVPGWVSLRKKRLLIRVQVESGRVVSESSHYTED